MPEKQVMSKKLKFPPLIEVLCEFRFTPSNDWDWTLPGRLYEQIGEEFNKRSQVSQFAFQLQSDDNTDNTDSPQVIRTPQRVQLRRSSDSAMVQIGPDTLVVNYLNSYSSWEDFRSLVINIFSKYIKLLDNEFSLDGISLRYINQINISQEGFNPDDYITVKPNLKDVLNKELLSFYQRYEVVYDSPDGILIHQTGLSENKNKQTVMILDLDFDSKTVAELTDILHIESWLNQAHEHIEEAFIASLNPHYYQQIKGDSI